MSFNEIYPDKETLGEMNAVSFLQPKHLNEEMPNKNVGDASIIASLFCSMYLMDEKLSSWIYIKFILKEIVCWLLNSGDIIYFQQKYNIVLIRWIIHTSKSWLYFEFETCKLTIFHDTIIRFFDKEKRTTRMMMMILAMF